MLGVRCDVDIFKLTARAQSIHREIYVKCYFYTSHNVFVVYMIKCDVFLDLPTMKSMHVERRVQSSEKLSTHVQIDSELLEYARSCPRFNVHRTQLNLYFGDDCVHRGSFF